MTLRVYIAGASAEIDRAARAVHFATIAGMRVTHDWPTRMRAQQAPESKMHASVLRPELEDCLSGVMKADALWLLLPSRGFATVGEWVELGYALCMRDHGIRLATVASCIPFGGKYDDRAEVNGWARCFANAITPTDDAALEWLRQLAAKNAELAAG